MSSLNGEFLHIGTRDICVSDQCPVKDQDKSFSMKPNGGLWLSEYCTDMYNSWVDYLLDHSYLLYFKNRDKVKDMYVQPCSIVTLRKDANIYELDNFNKLDYLLNNYGYDNGKFSYEELSKYFEGIYVDFWFFFRHNFSKIHDFCVNSLILFDLEAIDYYYSGNVMLDRVDPITWDTPYEIKRDNIKKKVLIHE